MAPDGKPAMTSAGCTMDMALIRELFANLHGFRRVTRDGCGVCGQAQSCNTEARALPDWKVRPTAGVGRGLRGQRLLSHMYPLYPGSQITPQGTPELARATRISLERRLAAGGAYTGWSRAWAIGFWAKLQDVEKASRSRC
jgi:alpha-L-fucosidase 2